MRAISLVLLCLVFTPNCEAYSSQCPYGWLDWSGQHSCYYVSQDDAQKTWNDARLKCQAQGGDLVKIDSSNERDWLLTQLGKITASQSNYQHWWTGASATVDGKTMRWADNSTVNTQLMSGKWYSKQPLLDSGHQCMQIYNKQFGYESCSASFQSICERPKSKILTCDTDNGWELYNSVCYKHFSVPLPWADARQRCESGGADLAVIPDATTQTTLWDWAKTHGFNIWTGLQYLPNNTWQWSNGSSLSQWGKTYWASGQPGKSLDGNCVEINHNAPNNQSWVASTCIAPRQFVCQRPEGVCPAGWWQQAGHCFKIFPGKAASFQMAQTACAAMGATLGMIKGWGDYDRLQSYNHDLRNAKVGSYWIGLTDNNQNNGPWTWVDGSTASFTHFSSSKPSNSANKQDCFYIVPDGSGNWHVTNSCDQPRNYLCQISADQQLLVPTPPAISCPKGWLLYQGQCFLLNNDDKAWEDARQWCQGQQATLARIPDAGTQAFLQAQTMNKGDFWFGLNDRHKEGLYAFLDETTKATYYNWMSGQPDNKQQNENCVSLYGGKDSNNHYGRWHDVLCTQPYNFLCQKPAVSSGPQATTTPVAWSPLCGPFWELNPHNGACYQFNDDQLTWLDALNSCKGRGGSLLSITSVEEQYYISGRLFQSQSLDVWIGASDSTNEGGWTWSDGSPFSFFNWGSGEPSNGNAEDCAALQTTHAAWHDTKCTNRNGFVCKKWGKMTTTTVMPTTSPQSAPPGMVYGCPPTWSSFRGSCYKLSRSKFSWDDARSNCQHQSGDLVSILDKAENNYVFSLLPKGFSNSTFLWIGLNDLQVSRRFTWTTANTPVTFTNWAFGEPNNYKGRIQNCVGMASKDGRWADLACSDTFAGFFCKRPPSFLPASQVQKQQGCPTGMAGYGAQCYTFQNQAVGWQAAEAQCRQQKGHLATLDNPYVQAFLAAEGLLKGGSYWIGLADLQSPGSYKWTSGMPFAYSNWYSTHTGLEQATCVAMRTVVPAGLWENYNCTDRHPFVCEIPRTGFTTLATPAPTPLSILSCPPGWIGLQAWCYMATNLTQANQLTWMEARDACQNFGGNLVGIHNASLETFLANTLLGGASGVYWIGLNDRDQEKSHEWVDGSPFDYAHWASHEPNDFGHSEDCVTWSSSSGTWNDANCYIATNFICQLQIGVTIPPTSASPTVVTSSRCQGNGTWYDFGQGCYWVSPDSGPQSRRTWFGAQLQCRALGGDLVSVSSIDENNFLTSLVSKAGTNQYWIGLNDLGLSAFSWSDNAPVTFVQWAAGEPNNGYGEESCVVIYNKGLWNDAVCTISNRYVCKKRPGSLQPVAPSPTALVQGGCPRGFSSSPLLNKCFYVSPPSVMTNWTDARDACKQMGGILASVAMWKEEAMMISLLLGRSRSVWLGLSDIRIKNTWEWLDNTPVNFTAWDTNEPASDTTKGSAGRMCAQAWSAKQGRHWVGRWFAAPCSDLRSYVCHAFKRSNIPVDTPDQSGCPSGYNRYGGSCYSFLQTPLSWQSAQAQCRREGGHLGVIQDRYEQAYVSAHLPPVETWIGLSDTQVSGTYSWGDSWPVTYTNWGKNEPSRGPGEGCVLLNVRRMWNDTLCSTAHPAICEIDVVPMTPPTTPSNGGRCPDNDWILARGRCYYVQTAQPRNFGDARAQCAAYGGDLVSVQSGIELRVITNLLSTNPTAAGDVWIGLTKAFGGGFQWTDGSAAGYFNWDAGQPSDPDSSAHQDCVIMTPPGTWDDVACSLQKSFVCKAPAATVTQAVVVTNGQGNVVTNTRGVPVTQIVPVTPRRGPHGNPFGFSRGPRTAPHLVTAAPGTNGPFTNGPVTNAPAQQTNSNPGSGGGLSGGGIAGIVIALIVIVCGVGLALYWLRLRKATLNLHSSPEGYDNALYDNRGGEVTVSPKLSLGAGRSSEDC